MMNECIKILIYTLRYCSTSTSSTRHRVDVWPSSSQCVANVTWRWPHIDTVSCSCRGTMYNYVSSRLASWYSTRQRWSCFECVLPVDFAFGGHMLSPRVQNCSKLSRMVSSLIRRIQRAIQGDTRDCGIKGLNAGSFWCVAIVRTLLYSLIFYLTLVLRGVCVSDVRPTCELFVDSVIVFLIMSSR